MKVFVIPSWYPSTDHPYTGIFFKEQARLMGKTRTEWKIGLSLWGSHEESLLLKASRPLHSLLQSASKKPIKPHHQRLEDNVIEFFTPAYTWTRKIRNGNMKGIIAANEQNLDDYTKYFGKPDIIHAHVAYPAGEIARRLSLKYQIPYVVTEHMSPFPMESFKRDYRKTLLPALEQADEVMGVSQALVDKLSSFGIKATHLSNCVDDSLFKPNSKKKSKIFTIVWVGRLAQQKQPVIVLNLARNLVKKNIEFRLVMIGDGPMEKKLKITYADLTPFIKWRGALEAEEISDALQSAHVLVNTSAHENQPVSILEALSSGLPVYTLNWAGAEEIIHQMNGRILKNEGELTHSLMELDKSNPYESDKIRADFLECWGSEKVIKQLDEVYLKAIRVK